MIIIQQKNAHFQHTVVQSARKIYILINYLYLFYISETNQVKKSINRTNLFLLDLGCIFSVCLSYYVVRTILGFHVGLRHILSHNTHGKELYSSDKDHNTDS